MASPLPTEALSAAQDEPDAPCSGDPSETVKLDSSTSTSEDTVRTAIPRIALIDENDRRRSIDSASSARSSQSSDKFFGSVVPSSPSRPHDHPQGEGDSDNTEEEKVRHEERFPGDELAHRLEEENGSIEDTLQQILRDEEALKLKYQKLRQMQQAAADQVWGSQSSPSVEQPRQTPGAQERPAGASEAATCEGRASSLGPSSEQQPHTPEVISPKKPYDEDVTLTKEEKQVVWLPVSETLPKHRGLVTADFHSVVTGLWDHEMVDPSHTAAKHVEDRTWSASEDEDAGSASTGEPVFDAPPLPNVFEWDPAIGDSDGYSTLDRLTTGSRDGSYSPFSILSTPCHSFRAGSVFPPTGPLPDLTQVGTEPPPPPEPQSAPETPAVEIRGGHVRHSRPASIVEHPAWGQIGDLDRALAYMEQNGPRDFRPTSRRWTDIDDVLSELEADEKGSRERLAGREVIATSHVGGFGQLRDSRISPDSGYQKAPQRTQRDVHADPDMVLGVSLQHPASGASEKASRKRRGGHLTTADSSGTVRDDWVAIPPRGRALGLVGYAAAPTVGQYRSVSAEEPSGVGVEPSRRVHRSRAPAILAEPAQIATGGRFQAVHQRIVHSTNEMAIPGRSTPATVHSYQEMVIKQVIDSTVPPDPSSASGRGHSAATRQEWPESEPVPVDARRRFERITSQLAAGPRRSDPAAPHYPSYVSERDFEALSRGVENIMVSDTDGSGPELAFEDPPAAEHLINLFANRHPSGRPAVGGGFGGRDPHASAFRPIRPEPLRPPMTPQQIHRLPISSAGRPPLPPPPAGHGELADTAAACARSSTLPRARPRQPTERGRRSKSERRRRKELRHSERRLRRVRYGRSGVAGYRRITLRKSRRDLDYGFSVIGGAESGLGVFVSRLEQQGLARSAGLRVGDELIIVNGLDIRRSPLHYVQQMISESVLLDVMIKTMGNGDNYVISHTYTWCDPEGREVTPPPDLTQTQRDGGHDRKVDLSLEMGESLGVMIRGGAEYGLGIYVTGVDMGSAADRAGIQVGDQILDVNNQSFLDITHDEAVSILKYCKTPLMSIRPVGKVPCASYISESGRHRFQTAISETSGAEVGAASAGDWRFGDAGAAPPDKRSQLRPGQRPILAVDEGTLQPPDERILRDTRREERSPSQREESACWAGAERRQPGLDPWSDPALVAVYEKASVLLRGHEFRLFDELVVRYLSRRLDVVRLVGSLLELLRSPEKLTLLTELREIVTARDQLRFDQMVYHRTPAGPHLQQDFQHSAGVGGHLPGAAAYWRAQQPPISRSPSDDSGVELPNGTLAASLFRSLGEEDWPLASRPRLVSQRYLDQGGRLSQCQPLVPVARETTKVASQLALAPGDAPAASSDPQTRDCSLQRLSSSSPLFSNPKPVDLYPASPILEDPEGNIKITVPKNKPLLGIVIEGGANTSQPLPRIVNIQPYGSAFSAGGLMVGQVIKSVDGKKLVGADHQRAAQVIAEAYANKKKHDIEFVVRELKRQNFNVKHCAPDVVME